MPILQLYSTGGQAPAHCSYKLEQSYFGFSTIIHRTLLVAFKNPDLLKLFPFCSANYILMPCKNICVSVKADCHRTFMLHCREWPEYLNCSSFPSAPDLCLSPSSSPSSRNSSFTTPSPSNHSRPTITASFPVISLAPLFLLLLVFAFFFLRYLFCFHEAPQINHSNAIRYAAPPPSQAISLQSLPRENSEPPAPPSATPPPPPLPPKRRHQTETLYENSNLYAVTKLNF